MNSTQAIDCAFSTSSSEILGRDDMELSSSLASSSSGVMGHSRRKMSEVMMQGACEVCEERCLASGVMEGALERFEQWKRGESVERTKMWLSEEMQWNQSVESRGFFVMPSSEGTGSFDLSPDHSFMVTSRFGGTMVELRDVRTGVVLWEQTIGKQNDRVGLVKCSPDGRLIAITKDRGTVEVLEMETGTSVWKVTGGRWDKNWDYLGWSGDGSRVLTQRPYSGYTWYDRITGEKKVMVNGVHTVEMLGEGLVTTFSNQVAWVDRESGSLLGQVNAGIGMTGRLSVSAQSGLVSVIDGLHQKSGVVLDLVGKKVIGGVERRDDYERVDEMIVSPSGRFLFSHVRRGDSSIYRQQEIYRGLVGGVLSEMTLNRNGVGGFTFSADGSMVYGLGAEGVMMMKMPERAKWIPGTTMAPDLYRWGDEPKNAYRVLQERAPYINPSWRGSVDSYRAAVALAPAGQRSDTYRYYTMGGSPQEIFEVCYVNSEGVWTVPSEFYEKVGDNGVIVFPGCFKNIVLKSRMKHGARNGNFEIQLKKETTNRAEVLPINRVQFRALTVNTLQDGDRGEGFGGVISEAPSYSRALLEYGRTVTVQMNLWNEGMMGGVRELAIAVGYETDGSNPIVKRFSRNFGAMEGVSLQFSVTDPGDPRAREFPHRRPMITVWSIDPATGAREIIHEIAGRVTEYRVNERDRAAFLANLAREQSGLLMYGRDGTTVIGQGGRVFAEESSSERSPGVVIAPSSPSAVIDALLSDTRVLLASVDDLNRKLVQKINDQQVNMGKMVGGKETKRLERVPVSAESSTSVRFELQEAMMVTIEMDRRNVGLITGTGIQVSPNIDLMLDGSALNASISSSHQSVIPYPASVQTASEVVSQILPAGTYILTVADRTNYQTLGKSLFAKKITLPPIPLSFEVKPLTTGSIEGKVANEGKVAPVRMHRAAFDASGKRLAPESLPPLDPTKPLWVVVHGMNSREDFDTIEELTEELTLHSVTQQVMSVDWREAAYAPKYMPGTDAPWTPLVGEFIATQLLTLGFTPDKLHFVGHSHGTYVSYAAAHTMMTHHGGKKVNAMVALDPAGNFSPVTRFDSSHINFSAIAERSIALEGSYAAGSNVLAGTADVAFQVDSPNTDSAAFWNEHSLPISTFTNLLWNNRIAQSDVPEYLQLEVIAGIRRPSHVIKKNIYKNVYEGVITVSAKEKTSTVTGESYYDAMPNLIEYEDDAGNWKKRMIPTDATIISGT